MDALGLEARRCSKLCNYCSLIIDCISFRSEISSFYSAHRNARNCNRISLVRKPIPRYQQLCTTCGGSVADNIQQNIEDLNCEEEDFDMFAAKQSLKNYALLRRQLRKGVTPSATESLLPSNTVLVYKFVSIANCRFSSSMAVEDAEGDEESKFALILGKPGGGKGTISGKILKVCFDAMLFW